MKVRSIMSNKNNAKRETKGRNGEGGRGKEEREGRMGGGKLKRRY